MNQTLVTEPTTNANCLSRLEPSRRSLSTPTIDASCQLQQASATSSNRQIVKKVPTNNNKQIAANNSNNNKKPLIQATASKSISWRRKTALGLIPLGFQWLSGSQLQQQHQSADTSKISIDCDASSSLQTTGEFCVCINIVSYGKHSAFNANQEYYEYYDGFHVHLNCKMTQ